MTTAYDDLIGALKRHWYSYSTNNNSIYYVKVAKVEFATGYCTAYRFSPKTKKWKKLQFKTYVFEKFSRWLRVEDETIIKSLEKQFLILEIVEGKK